MQRVRGIVAGDGPRRRRRRRRRHDGRLSPQGQSAYQRRDQHGADDQIGGADAPDAPLLRSVHTLPVYAGPQMAAI